MIAIALQVELARLPRARCPRCGMRRVLYRLTATGNDRLVGHGEAACGTCAGFRRANHDRLVGGPR